MNDTDSTAPPTPLEIFAANRELALAEADVCASLGYSSLENFARGQAQSYGEAIRILSTPERVVFRCPVPFADGSPCNTVASFVTSDGVRSCWYHAPADVSLTISEHDDQRDRA